MSSPARAAGVTQPKRCLSRTEVLEDDDFAQQRSWGGVSGGRSGTYTGVDEGEHSRLVTGVHGELWGVAGGRVVQLDADWGPSWAVLRNSGFLLAALGILWNYLRSGSAGLYFGRVNLDRRSEASTGTPGI